MCKVDVFRERLKEKGIDAAIIYNEINQRYLCNFSFTDGYIIITQDRALLVTDFRYKEMAEHATVGFEILTPLPGEDIIAAVVSDNNVRSLGLEGRFVPFAKYLNLKARYSGVDFVDIEDMIEQMRSVKDEVEISAISKAQDITDAAFSHLLSVIKPDMTELEVAAELEYAMKRLGAERFAFETISVSGHSSSMPHGHQENIKLRRGFLTLDFGAVYGGYCSDMTRTIVIGRIDQDMKSMYNTALSAQNAALDYLAFGGRDAYLADKQARDIIDAVYPGAFGHSLGHGVGLEVHESPNLSPRKKGVQLIKGNVVTVEPGIYLYGKYGLRIEDMVLVTSTGIRNFTKSTKEIIEII